MSKSKREIRRLFPQRRPETHKGDYGKVFVLAGSEGMLGAAVLCSRGALRVGAGLVYLQVPEACRDGVNLATPEVIVASAEQAAFTVQAVAVGPGLGQRRAEAKDLLVKLQEHGFNGPVVVDADGLNAFNELTELNRFRLKLILTPHPGELARLLGKTAATVQNEREKLAAEAAGTLKCVVVLKGHRTVVADERGELYINNTGNPGMATAGTGDVLAGMIAGIAAQGADPFQAACAGVYLHGSAGDLAAREQGEYGLIASDLLGKVPQAILRL